MRIKRNQSAPRSYAGEASGGFERNTNLIMSAQRKSKELDDDFTKIVGNVGIAVGAGLYAGFSGQTSEDTGAIASGGVNAKDAGGFDFGKFAKETHNALGGTKQLLTPTEKQNVGQNLLSSYERGVDVGNAYAKNYGRMVSSEAKASAEASFVKSMKSGDFKGASARAWDAYSSTMAKYADDEKTPKLVANNINDTMGDQLTKSVFMNEYMTKEVNGIAERNAMDARQSISKTKDMLLPMDDGESANLIFKENIVMLEESKVISFTPQEKEALLGDFQSSRVQYALTNPDATVASLEYMSNELKKDESESYNKISNEAKREYRDKIESRKTQLQTRNYADLGESVVMAVESADGHTIDNEAGQLKQKMKDGEITGAQYITLKNKLFPKSAKSAKAEVNVGNVAKSRDAVKQAGVDAMRIVTTAGIDPDVASTALVKLQGVVNENKDLLTTADRERATQTIERAGRLLSDQLDTAETHIKNTFDVIGKELLEDADDDEKLEAMSANTQAMNDYYTEVSALGADATIEKKMEIAKRITDELKDNELEYKMKESIKKRNQQSYSSLTVAGQTKVNTAKARGEETIARELQADVDADKASEEASKTEVFSTHTVKAIASKVSNKISEMASERSEEMTDKGKRWNKNLKSAGINLDKISESITSGGAGLADMASEIAVEYGTPVAVKLLEFVELLIPEKEATIQNTAISDSIRDIKKEYEETK